MGIFLVAHGLILQTLQGTTEATKTDGGTVITHLFELVTYRLRITQPWLTKRWEHALVNRQEGALLTVPSSVVF